MSFADYENFESCVLENQDKDNPEAFCAWLHYEETGKWPGEKDNKNVTLADIVFKKAGGHFGHEGLPGQVGGSAASFSGAGSIEEATKFAEENIAEKVDYSGIPVESANRINKTIYQNVDLNTEEQKIVAIRPIKTFSTADAQVTGKGEILYNERTFSYPEDYESSQKSINAKDRYQSVTEEDVAEADQRYDQTKKKYMSRVPADDREKAEQIMGEIEAGKSGKMNELNKLMELSQIQNPEAEYIVDSVMDMRKERLNAKKIKENVDIDNFERHQVSENIEELITHEIGHELARRNTDIKFEEYMDPDDILDTEVARQYNMSDWDNKEHQAAKHKISEYANTNLHEYIAESYLAFQKGMDVHPKMESFIKGELKHHGN